MIWDESGFLKRIRNNETLAKKLINMFIDDIAEVEAKLIIAIENHEFTEIISYAHKITGSAANLGGVNLANVSQRIEKTAKTENIPDLSLLKIEVITEYKMFIETLRAYLNADNIAEPPLNKEVL